MTPPPDHSSMYCRSCDYPLAPTPDAASISAAAAAAASGTTATISASAMSATSATSATSDTSDTSATTPTTATTATTAPPATNANTASASEHACPECGRRFDPHEPTTWAPRPSRRLARAVTILRHVVACTFVGMLGLVAWTLIGIDQWVGVSAHPGFLIASGIIGTGLVAAAWGIGSSKWYGASAIPFVLVVTALAIGDFSRIKPLLRALDAMTPETTRADAKAIMAEHFPVDGRFPRPVIIEDTAERLAYSVDPNHGGYNAAIATITFDPATGTVVETEFLPD